MHKIDLFDGHADTLFQSWTKGSELCRNNGHLDLTRARAAFGRYAQFFAIFGLPELRPETRQSDIFFQQYEIFQRELSKNAALVAHCRTAEDAVRANDAGKIAAFLSVEGAELLDCSLARLEDAWEKGVRAVNLTWNHANALSGSSREEPERGLSEEGRAFVRRMQELGMLVDVSHLSDHGFWDVAELAEDAGKPFVAGHSNARVVCPHPRNLTDEQFLAIIQCGGVVGLNLCDEFVGEPPTMDTLLAHVEHWLSLGGQHSIALGGDWDGCRLIPEITDITGAADIYERLLQRNYAEELVHAMFYDNMMRVVKEVCTT